MPMSTRLPTQVLQAGHVRAGGNDDVHRLREQAGQRLQIIIGAEFGEGLGAKQGLGRDIVLRERDVDLAGPQQAQVLVAAAARDGPRLRAHGDEFRRQQRSDPGVFAVGSAAGDDQGPLQPIEPQGDVLVGAVQDLGDDLLALLRMLPLAGQQGVDLLDDAPGFRRTAWPRRRCADLSKQGIDRHPAVVALREADAAMDINPVAGAVAILLQPGDALLGSAEQV